jgi:C-terminal processing protease CtpA/Prc
LILLFFIFLKVTEGSVAYNAGLRAGDTILAINDIDTSKLEHNEAKQEIILAGDEFRLIVLRNSIDITKPKYTPLSQLRSLPIKDLGKPAEIPKTDLTVLKEVCLFMLFYD